jgi:hypothetical protein
MLTLKPGAWTPYAAMSGNSLQQETRDLLSRMTVQPSASRVAAIDVLIADLKASGIWSKLSGFYDFAAETEQQALLNWCRNVTGTNQSGCTWTAGQGYKSVASSVAHVDLGFGTETYIDTRNSISFGCWTNVSGSSPAVSRVQMGLAGSTGRLLLDANGSTFNETYRINDTSNTIARAGTSDRRGHRTMVRPDSSTKRSYFNGVQNGSDQSISANAAQATGNFSLFRNGSSYNNDADGIWGAYVGSALTSAEVGSLHTHVSNYKQTAGIS